MFKDFEDFKESLGTQLGVTDKKAVASLWGGYIRQGQPSHTFIKHKDWSVEVKERVLSLHKPVSEEISPLPFEVLLAKKYVEKYKNALKRGIDFELTLADMKRILKKKKCYFTGIDIVLEPYKGEPPYNYLTLDRVDPDQGYTKENTVACSHAANQLKSTLERGDEDGLELRHKLKLMAKMLEVM